MPLTRTQQLVALMLGEGMLVKGVSSEAGVSQSSITRWRSDPEFAALVVECSDPVKAFWYRVLFTSEDEDRRERAARHLRRPVEGRSSKEGDGITIVRIERRDDGTMLVNGEPWPAEASTS